MMSFGEYAAFLRRSAEMVPAEIEAISAVIAETAGVEAMHIIGHRQANWPTLKDVTKEKKAKLGFSAPEYEPLLRSGAMRESIRWISTSMGGAIGSNDKTLFWHEVGTTKMEPRPVLANAMFSVIPLMQHLLGESAVKLLVPVTR